MFETYKDLLTSVNGVTITYDETTLNPISIGNDITLSFKGRGLSEYIDVTNNIHNKYYYDHNGNRVLKEEYDSSNNLVKSTRYYYDDKGKMIQQDDGTYKLTFLYDELDQLYGFIYNNNRYCYVKNVLGNILAIIDNNKSKVVEYRYNAWGEVTSTSGTLAHINPFRYKGYYYDSDIKMYYCKSRYYVPSWKRWLNADSPKYLDNNDTNNLNLFVYCGNEPIDKYDPIGFFSWGIPILIFSVVAIIATIVNHLISIDLSKKAEENVKDKYTKEEAKKVIEQITGEGTVVFGEKAVNITDSNRIDSRYERILISKIIQNTVDENGNYLTYRSTYSLSAEWYGHNILSSLGIANSSTDHVDLDYEFKDNEFYTELGTLILMFLGML